MGGVHGQSCATWYKEQEIDEQERHGHTEDTAEERMEKFCFGRRRRRQNFMNCYPDCSPSCAGSRPSLEARTACASDDDCELEVYCSSEQRCTKYDADWCTKSNKCGLGDGDCDDDEGCAG